MDFFAASVGVCPSIAGRKSIPAPRNGALPTGDTASTPGMARTRGNSRSSSASCSSFAPNDALPHRQLGDEEMRGVIRELHVLQRDAGCERRDQPPTEPRGRARPVRRRATRSRTGRDDLPLWRFPDRSAAWRPAAPSHGHRRSDAEDRASRASRSPSPPPSVAPPMRISSSRGRSLGARRTNTRKPSGGDSCAKHAAGQRRAARFP